MRPALSISITALVFFSLLATVCKVEASQFEGMEIKRVELHTEANVSQEEFFSLIKINVGQKFEKRAVERSVRNLFMKGFFSDIVLEAEPWEGGVVLRYKTKNILIVDRYKISGNQAFSDRKIRGAVGMKKTGEIFSGRRNAELARKISAFYQDEGFFDTDIKVKVGEPDFKGRVQVDLEIKQGRPYKIEKVLLEAPPGFPADLIKSRVGEIYRPRVLSNDIDRIKKWLKKETYHPAIAPTYKVDLNEKGRAAALRINVAAGPKLNIIFSGNQSVTAAKLIELVPVGPAEEPDEKNFDQGKKAIESFYRQKGFHFVTVQWKRGAALTSNIRGVIYSIDEGPSVGVESIESIGNKGISSGDLKKGMELKEKKFFGAGRFSAEVLEKDLGRIAGLYKQNGYLDAKAKLKSLKFNADRSLAYISIEVDEGRQTKVKTIKFVGNSAATDEQLSGALSLKKGRPYSQELVEAGTSEILLYYSSKGYLDARVEKAVSLSDDKNWAELKYSIAEDGKTVFGDFFVKGNFKTKKKVIDRNIGFATGEPFDPQKIVKARRNLDSLGIFRSVRFEPLKAEKKDEEKERELLLELQEKDSKQINFGVGFDSEELLRGFAEYVDSNLMGMDRVMRLRIEASFLRQIFSTNFEEPHFLGSNVRSNYTFSAREVEDIETFNSRTFEGLADFERDFGPKYTGAITYKFQDIRLSSIKIERPITEEDISGRFASEALRLIPALTAKDLQDFNVSSLIPSVRRDTRSDKLDPKKGSYNLVSFELASDLFVSGAEFYKIIGESKWYLPISSDMVLALSARSGLAKSFGMTPEVPLPIRFFTGGSNTVRGFELNSLGPKGTDDFPFGGELLTVFNAELRLQLPKKFQGVVFSDNGNVFAEPKDFSLSDLRNSAGLGVRYISPIGPIRLDWGRVVDHEPGEKPWRLHFSFGHAF